MDRARHSNLFNRRRIASVEMHKRVLTVYVETIVNTYLVFSQ